MRGNALVIAIGKGKPGSSEKEPPGVSDSADEGAAESNEDSFAEELASVLRVDARDMDDFKMALTGFVRACVKKDSEGGYDEGDAAEG